MNSRKKAIGISVLVLLVLVIGLVVFQGPPKMTPEDRISQALQDQSKHLTGQVTIVEIKSDPAMSYADGGQFVAKAPRSLFFKDPSLKGDHVFQGTYHFTNTQKWDVQTHLSYWKAKLSGGNFRLYTDDRATIHFPSVVESVQSTRDRLDSEEAANLAAELRQNLIMVGPHQRNSKTVVDGRLLIARLQLNDKNWQGAAQTLTAVREGVVHNPQFSERFQELRDNLASHLPASDPAIPPPLP